MTEDYRPPDSIELALLKKLLERDFPGRDELVDQLDGLSVSAIDQAGSLALRPSSSAVRANVQQRIAAEGHYFDEDSDPNEGVQIHLLLHVVEGRLDELEIYKDDDSPIRKRPSPENVLLD